MKAGKFTCEVLAPTSGWFGAAGENDTPFIRIPLIVTEAGECEGDGIEFQGWLTDRSLDRTVKNLADVFGWDGDLEALAKLVKTGPFVGLPCQVVTEEEEYKGKRMVKIKWLNRADGSGKTMDAAGVAALVKHFGARAKAAATGAPMQGAAPQIPFRPKKPGPDPLAPADDSDSIPF